MKVPRKIWVSLLLVAGLIAGFFLVDSWCNQPCAITEANFKKIRQGMTEMEISQVLHRPADRVMLIEDGTSSTIWFGPKRSWAGEAGGIIVGFTEDGRASFMRFDSWPLRPRPPLWERLWKWLTG